MTDDPRHIQFAKDPSRRAELANVLANSAFREALEIAEELMEPQTGTQAEVAPAIAAAKYHQIAGAAELMKKLRAMTREPKEVKAPKPKALARTVADLPPAT